jgi:membrane-associated phospholipid phosphatase
MKYNASKRQRMGHHFERLQVFFATLLFLAATGRADPVPDSIYSIHLLSDSAIILTGAAVTAGAYASEYQIINQSCPCDPNGINFLDKNVVANTNHAADILANYTVTLAVILPVLADYLDVGLTKAFAEDIFVYSEVLSINFGLVTIAKFGVQRPYPYMYQRSFGSGYQSEPNDYLSFYSAHTSTTFSALSAAAVTLNLRHGKEVWPWLVTGALGTSVAVELVISAEHFISDVIVGAFMGAAEGILIPLDHAKGDQPSKRIYFISSRDGPLLQWRYDF